MELLKKIVLMLAVLALLPLQGFAQGETQAKSEKMVIEFDAKVHDFGDILISDGPVSCNFKFRNIGTDPIVVHNVVSSCGCTTPDWSREPIRPGESGNIKVVFSNNQGPYPFEKTLTVYVSGVNRPVVLRIRGTVHEKKKDISALFPIHMGKLGIRKKSMSLGYIDQGTSKSDNMEVANLSREKLSVTFCETTPGMEVTVSPNPIPAKSTATMTFRVNTRKMAEQGWGKQNFYTKFKVGDKTYEEQFQVTATIKDNFGNLTAEQIKKAGVPTVDKSYNELGEVKAGTVVESHYKIRNTGKEPLTIHKVETESKGVTCLTACPFTIKSGETADFGIKYDSTGQDGEVLVILTAICDSPSKPMFNLFLTGNAIK